MRPLTLWIGLRIGGPLFGVEECLREWIVLDLQTGHLLVLIRRHRDELRFGKAIGQHLHERQDNYRLREQTGETCIALPIPKIIMIIEL